MRDVFKPVIPLAVENDDDHLDLMSNGEVRQAAMVILSEEDVGRMRAGYVCAMCMEAHGVPFPEACLLCRFPMRDKQSEYLAKAYQGRVRMGPSTSDADELAAMEELEERLAFEEAGRKPAPMIWLPRGI